MHDDARMSSREAASADLELDMLAEAHRALVGAHAACADPELYGPLAAAMERTVSWLSAVAAEVSSLQSSDLKQNDCFSL